MHNNKKLLGEILVEGGWITREDLDTALETQRQGGHRIGKILVESGVLSEITLEMRHM